MHGQHRQLHDRHLHYYCDLSLLLPLFVLDAYACARQTKWVAGTYVEVAWGPLYNHGGGYQYVGPSIWSTMCCRCVGAGSRRLVGWCLLRGGKRGHLDRGFLCALG